MVRLALFMVVVAAPIAAMAHDEAPQKPALTVTGHGRMSRAPDTVFVTLGMETTGRTVADAQRQNSLAMNKVVERLKALQIENERIQTTSFTVAPQYKPPPKRADPSVGPPEIIGYVVSNTMTIEVRQVDKVGTVIEESLTAGANHFQSLHWGLRDERQPKLEVLKEAASKAREKASALSEALKVKLVRLLTVSEDSHLARPVPKMARSMMAHEAGGPETPVFSGEINVEATVTLIYEIAQE